MSETSATISTSSGESRAKARHARISDTTIGVE